MRLNHSEAVHLCAVLHNVLLDLRDRGDVPAVACEHLMARLAEGGQLLDELPLFGKALDAFLLLDETVDRTEHQLRLEELYSKSLPIFGSQFAADLTFGDPAVMPANIILALRDLAFLYYKYEAPYDEALVSKAVEQFVSTDEALAPVDLDLSADAALLERLFRKIDLADIMPCHGPGAVADKAAAPQKYDWSTFPERLSNIYSYDYFVASYSHLCERLRDLMASKSDEPYARLLTVPKDSRGPRVISCEPKEFQWIQQGIRAKLYDWIERHPLTRRSIRFRDQTVNGELALSGSSSRDWATLDLSEASDRVALDYVCKVFPETVLPYILACRSDGTTLPDGRVIMLKKFAPMGSALCFPVLALTIWARLKTAGVDKCHVYGDDVIVPRTQVQTAITALEQVGLKVNRSKSCYTGLFRESCGVDAFNGSNVTPVRIRTRWSSRRHPSVYISWVSYANSLYDHGYVRAAEFIAAEIGRIYGPVPQSEGEYLNVPSFRFVTATVPQPMRRTNRELQLLEHRVWAIEPRRTAFNQQGWNKLLHWFSTSKQFASPGERIAVTQDRCLELSWGRTSWYTKRSDVRFVHKWTELRPIAMQQTASHVVL